MSPEAQRLRDMVRCGHFETALEQIIALFSTMATDLSFAGASFPFPLYDEVCTSIGHKSAFELLAPERVLINHEHDIVLITEATVQGGHVELIRDIASASERKLLIVATNLHNKQNKFVLPVLTAHHGVLDVVTLNDPTLVTRLHSAQALIANPSARRVIIMCHAYDAISIAAAAPVSDKPVLFFHHCDHTPCLGCYMPNAEHIDLHNLAFEQCHRELGLNPSYICLTSRDGAARRKDAPYARPMFKSITCGGEHKMVNFEYPISYSDLVVEIIRSRRGAHFHVGQLSSGFVETIRSALDAAGLPSESFIHVGHVSGFREIIETLEIDLYVPTLPQAGGKALVDAMSAGLPILVHENAIGRLWGGRDLVYPQAPSWNDFGTLLDCLRRFDDEAYWQAQVHASRAYFEENHSELLFKQMLRANGRFIGTAPPPLKPYRPSHHHWLTSTISASNHHR